MAGFPFGSTAEQRTQDLIEFTKFETSQTALPAPAGELDGEFLAEHGLHFLPHANGFLRGVDTTVAPLHRLPAGRAFAA